MSSYPQSMAFLEPKFETHSVQGVPVKFYPMSLGLAFKLKAIAQPLSKLFAILLRTDKNDAGTKIRLFNNEHGNPDSEQIGEAISPELASVRHQQTSQAIDEFFQSITSDTAKEVLALICMDSMREVFPPQNRLSVEDFSAKIHVPQLVEILAGVAKANKGVFGPLTAEFEAALSKTRQVVAERLGATQTAENSDPAFGKEKQPA